MPDGFFTGKNGDKWHEGPPRPGTVSMRATRFRLKAGCISWEPKAGSENIADYILKLLPQSCIDANSTLTFRDLSREEQEDATKPNKGTQPNRAGKAKLAANAEKEKQAQQSKRYAKEKPEDTQISGDDQLESQYGEQDYTTATDAWQSGAIARTTNPGLKRKPYPTQSIQAATSQSRKRGAMNMLGDSHDVGGYEAQSSKRLRDDQTSDATSRLMTAEEIPGRMRRSSVKVPSSLAPSRQSHKQVTNQPLQYDATFANNVSEIVTAGNVHTGTSAPWTAFIASEPVQDQYTSPLPSFFNNSVELVRDYDDPSNLFLFDDSNRKSYLFDDGSMPRSAGAHDQNGTPVSNLPLDVHFAEVFNSPHLPLGAQYTDQLHSPHIGGATAFDTQIYTKFGMPLPPNCKKGATSSILQRRQAQNLKVNHSAVLTCQDGDTVPAWQSFESTPPLARTAILKRKWAPGTTESPNEPREDAESRFTKRAKNNQHTQADLAEDLATVPNVIESPVAEASSEYTSGFQPDNFAALPLEPLGVHTINGLSVQAYSAQVDSWREEVFEKDGSGFHLPSAFDPGYDAENYMPSYQQGREAHAKNNDYEETFAPPTEQLPVWIEDLAGWGPRNEEAQIVLDML